MMSEPIMPIAAARQDGPRIELRKKTAAAAIRPLLTGVAEDCGGSLCSGTLLIVQDQSGDEGIG